MQFHFLEANFLRFDYFSILPAAGQGLGIVIREAN